MLKSWLSVNLPAGNLSYRSGPFSELFMAGQLDYHIESTQTQPLKDLFQITDYLGGNSVCVQHFVKTPSWSCGRLENFFLPSEVLVLFNVTCTANTVRGWCLVWAYIFRLTTFIIIRRIWCWSLFSFWILILFVITCKHQLAF